MTLYASLAGPRSSSDLYTIDPTTGVATSIATMSVALTGMAMDPTTGIMYGVTSNSSTNSRSLVTVDLITGATTIIGALHEAATSLSMADIAFDASGQLFGWDSNFSRLTTINKATGACIRLHYPGISTFGDGMDFDWQNHLFGCFRGDTDKIYQVNTHTLTTPVLPGVELALGAGPDDLDETYEPTALRPTPANGTFKVIAALCGTPIGGGVSIAAGAMQDDKFFIIVNNFGSPVWLATVNYSGDITPIGQTTDGMDAIATDNPGGRSDWYGDPSSSGIHESWEAESPYKITTPVLPGAELPLGGGPDDLDETYGRTTLQTSTIDPTVWQLRTYFGPPLDPNGPDSWFAHSKDYAVEGSYSMLLDGTRIVTWGSTSFNQQQLCYFDECRGGQSDLDYWIAFEFLIPSWNIVWNSNSGEVTLPDFSLTSFTYPASGTGGVGNTAMGMSCYNSDATHGYFYDWTGGQHDIQDGVWHEVRASYRRKSSSSHAVVTQYLDGVKIVDANEGVFFAVAPTGIAWKSEFRNAQWADPSQLPDTMLYVDPIIYQIGADPGPITTFDRVRPSFIPSGTVLYQPTMVPRAPFIPSTTTVFPPYLSGLILIDSPFIGATGGAFTAYLLDSLRARISEEVAQVLALPDDAKARISEEVAQVLLQPTDSLARISQEVAQVLVRITGPGRISQEVAQVLVSNVFEDINIELIDG